MAATGASAMQQLGIAAIRTFHRLGLFQTTIVLATPLAGARLRVLSLRVGHDFSASVSVFGVAKGVGWRRKQRYDFKQNPKVGFQ